MPKSKRNKVVSLTQTDKKGRENKERIFDEVRSNLDKYQYVWILNLESIRNNILQQIRGDWQGSKLLMGKQKVLQKSLGETLEEEYKENISKLSKIFEGVVGILFTDEKPEVVKSYFDNFVKTDFARANTKSPIDFVIPAGVVYSRGGQIPEEDDVIMQHTMEPQMRTQYKIPTKMKAGKVFLEEDYPVCVKGEKLDVRKASILRHFGIACAEFKVKLLGYYDNNSNNIEKLS